MSASTVRVQDLLGVVHSLYPPDLAAEWDNVGLQVGDPTAPVERVLVALDPGTAVVQAACAQGAQLLVTHHPLLFKPLRRLTPDDPVGRAFVEALARRAREGVRVRLLLQGQPEYALQFHAQRALYGQLLAGGIEIHEYVASYLHAKVAVVDEHWATVGSSNIDPYSLLLAREANVVVHDVGFARQLGGALDEAIEQSSRRIALADYASRGWIARARDWCAYFVVRLATVVLARGRDY